MSRSSNLLASVPVAQGQSGAVVRFRGSGQVIDIFSHFTDDWFTVGKVCKILRAQGIEVHRNTIRDGLNQLTNIGILEKIVPPDDKSGAATIYRRLLTDAQREFRAKQRARALSASRRDRATARAAGAVARGIDRA